MVNAGCKLLLELSDVASGGWHCQQFTCMEETQGCNFQKLQKNYFAITIIARPPRHTTDIRPDLRVAMGILGRILPFWEITALSWWIDSFSIILENPGGKHNIRKSSRKHVKTLKIMKTRLKLHTGHIWWPAMWAIRLRRRLQNIIISWWTSVLLYIFLTESP